MSYIDVIKEKARMDKKTIVLPETTDKRTLIAASNIMKELSRVTNSEEINRELKNRKVHSSCYPQLFDEIDITLFRKGLNIEICKQFILWANIGFTNQLLDEIRNSEKNANFDILIKRLDKYFDELRKIFYGHGNE